MTPKLDFPIYLLKSKVDKFQNELEYIKNNHRQLNEKLLLSWNDKHSLLTMKVKMEELEAKIKKTQSAIDILVKRDSTKFFTKIGNKDSGNE